jgi:hypothetical protein
MTDLEKCVEVENAIESLIDAHGLYAVTQALQIVCYDKSAHLAHAWQDYAAEKRWQRAAHVFDRAYGELRKIQLP